jgi:hypothetical protein
VLGVEQLGRLGVLFDERRSHAGGVLDALRTGRLRCGGVLDKDLRVERLRLLGFRREEGGVNDELQLKSEAAKPLPTEAMSSPADAADRIRRRSCVFFIWDRCLSR